MDHHNKVGMDDLPAEVLHSIFKNLADFKSVAAFRLQGLRYAEIGAEYLITRIRFHTTEESLQRLKHFANHPGVCKSIDTVTYEGNLLGSRTLGSYQSHFKGIHHGREMPVPPGDGASARATRLYKRNKEKFDKKISEDFNKYSAAYKQQRTVFHGALFREAVLGLANFPKLRHINLSTATRCAHSLSKRYRDAFDTSCSMPVELCSQPSISQLRTLILPNGTPLLGLQSLHVHALSPRFFSKKSVKQSTIDVFKSLKSIRLVFRLEEEARIVVEDTGPDVAYNALTKGYLHDALAAAQDAETILINFDDLGYYGPTTEVKTIMGATVWPKLTTLDLDCLKFTGDELLQTLQRQPLLKTVTLAFAYLLDGPWGSMLRTLKENLSLSVFDVRGLLEDNTSLYSTNCIDAYAYEEDHVEIHMGAVIDDFVTGDLWDEDEDFNPLDAFDWQDPEELYEKFGYPDDSDFDISMSNSVLDGDENEHAEDDDDLPELTPMDLD